MKNDFVDLDADSDRLDYQNLHGCRRDPHCIYWIRDDYGYICTLKSCIHRSPNIEDYRNSNIEQNNQDNQDSNVNLNINNRLEKKKKAQRNISDFF